MCEVTVLFDGCCGPCTRAARLLARLDRRGRVTLRPSQSPGVMAEYGLTRRQLDESVWLVAGSQRASGARAVALALDAALGVRLAGRFVAIAPIGRLAEAAYRWVARHRRWLPGMTPWCVSHPADCAAPGRPGA